MLRVLVVDSVQNTFNSESMKPNVRLHRFYSKGYSKCMEVHQAGESLVCLISVCDPFFAIFLNNKV